MASHLILAFARGLRRRSHDTSRRIGRRRPIRIHDRNEEAGYWGGRFGDENGAESGMAGDRSASTGEGSGSSTSGQGTGTFDGAADADGEGGTQTASILMQPCRASRAMMSMTAAKDRRPNRPRAGSWTPIKPPARSQRPTRAASILRIRQRGAGA